MISAKILKEWHESDENGKINCKFLQLSEPIYFPRIGAKNKIVLAKYPGGAEKILPAEEKEDFVEVGCVSLNAFNYQLKIVSDSVSSETPENNHTCVLCKNHRCNKFEKACWRCGFPIG